MKKNMKKPHRNIPHENIMKSHRDNFECRYTKTIHNTSPLNTVPLNKINKPGVLVYLLRNC